MAITASKRRTVGDRDGWRCHYCRVALTDQTMTLDHVYPHRRGGSNANWNLVAACEPCNNGFGDRLEKCDCASCLVAYDRHMTPDRGPKHRPVATIAIAAGFRWTTDGWQSYVAGDR